MLDIEKILNIKFPKEYIDFINNMDAINSKKIILLDEEENILIKNFLSLRAFKLLRKVFMVIYPSTPSFFNISAAI